MSTSSPIRGPISDTDRDHVVAELQRHVGAGRLTLDEFSDRARTAYQVHTQRELAELTSDLPAPRPTGATTAGRGRRASLIVVMALAAVLLGGGLLHATDAMTPSMPHMAQGCR